ncbi:Rv1476 family membrane protein [Gordonia sp. NPDC003424]
MTTGATTQDVLALPPLATPAPSIIPDDVDMSAILADLRDDGVSTSTPSDVPGLRTVVADAKHDGYQVSIVVLEQRQPKFTYYRDIATQLQSEVGGTVMVLGPDSVGSASPDFSRVDQEQATENLTLTNPPQAAQKMWDQMSGPSLNWTVISLVLIIVVVIGAVLARMRQVRARAAGPRTSGADPELVGQSAAGPGESAAPSDAPANDPDTRSHPEH